MRQLADTNPVWDPILEREFSQPERQREPIPEPDGQPHPTPVPIPSPLPKPIRLAIFGTYGFTDSDPSLHAESEHATG